MGCRRSTQYDGLCPVRKEQKMSEFIVFMLIVSISVLLVTSIISLTIICDVYNTFIRTKKRVIIALIPYGIILLWGKWLLERIHEVYKESE